MAGTKRILCIDGGGIRGLVPALVLRELESRISDIHGATKPLHMCFDMIGGTSTGGIIAAGLTAPHPDGSGKAACTPQDLVDLYNDDGLQIFPQGIFLKLRRLLRSKYDATPLEGFLKQRLGDATTNQALTNVVMPAYDITGRRAVFMAGGPAYGRDEPFYLMRDSARATSAAPTYFEPARIQVGGKPDYLSLVDGGVFANDPGMCALVEAIKFGWPLDTIEMLSIGTGSQNRPYSYFKVRNWSQADWVNPLDGAPILSILMQGASSTTSYQLGYMLNLKEQQRRYDRIAGPLTGNDEMDDASEANLDALHALAQTWISSFDDTLNTWARKLAAPSA